VRSLVDRLDLLEDQNSSTALIQVDSGLTIFIDNVNGNDSSTAPTVSLTPFKTFRKAWEFVREKYYFSDVNGNFLQFSLMSDYVFGVSESTVFEGSQINGGVSVVITSSNTVARTISASSKKPIVFKNFSYELQLKTVSFSSFVDIGFITRVIVTAVTFNKLAVKFCEVFYNLVSGSTFNGVTTLDSVDDIRFLATSVIRNAVRVSKGNTLQFGGQIDLGYYEVRQIVTATFLGGSSISEATLALAGGAPVFSLREINTATFNGALNLNSTSGILRRRLIVATNVNTVRGSTLVLNNTYSASIIYQSTNDGIFKFIYSEVTAFNLSAGTGFSPVFVGQDSTKKLISLEYSAYAVAGTGTTESQMLSTIFASTGRAVLLDLESSFFGENLVDQLKLSRFYKRSFTQSDLDSSDVLVVNHDLNQLAVSVWLYDSLGEHLNPLNMIAVNANVLNIYLGGYTPLTGTYNLIIQG
jgi:hypothetical protein